MNSYTFMGLDVEEGEEVNSRRKTFIKRAIAFIKNRRQANRLTRNNITRDRSGAHEHLVAAFFSEDPMYDATRFQKTFRMAHSLFNQIVNEEALIVRIGSGLVIRTALKGNMLDVIMVRIRSFCLQLLRHLKIGRAPEIPFVANGVTYPWGYYLVDGIYSELATLVKTIPEPADDDHKRILFKQKQESARKDVERVFGVLKKK
ncbi:ALP1-like protein [Tanacetum coccineum]